MHQETQGTSPKLKLGVTFASIATSLLTLAAVLFPDTLTPPVVAAVTGVIVTIAGAIGNYRGEPGNVTGFTSPEDAVESPPFNLHAAHEEDPPPPAPPTTG